MNWRAVYIAAQLAQTAYAETLASAVLGFNALGYKMVGQYLDTDHQAFMLLGPEGFTLAISGTRFGRSLGDLLDDADIVGVSLGDGSLVARGPYRGLSAMWVWALSLLPAEQTLSICGHSLGGERSLLSELFFSADRMRSVFSFEAPKCGNNALWAKLAKSMTKAVCVINGQDLWAGWPAVSGWHHPPVAHIHLDGAGFAMVGPDVWPAAIDANDHSISIVVDRLGKIADAMPTILIQGT